MKYITLVCAGGMSTSILVKKMQDAARKEEIEVSIIAMSESSFASYKEPTDVLLLGPQVGYLLSDMKKEYEPAGMKVEMIDMLSYGRMDGPKVLHMALDLMACAGK